MLDNKSKQGFARVPSKSTAHQIMESTLTCPPEEFTDGIAEYEAAITRNSASFLQLGSAVLYSKQQFSCDPSERALYGRYVQRLTGPFEAEHGEITHSFYCERILAAAILTKRAELYTLSPTPEAEEVGVANILFECEHLNVEADRVLARTDDLMTTKMLIYNVVTKLLSLLDKQTPLPAAVLELHRKEAKHAQDYYDRAAARHAKFNYFLGMMLGAFLCAAIIAISALILNVSTFDFTANRLIGCLAAGVGAVGAVVSVMSRTTFGKLSLDYEAGRRMLIVLGVFRPAIGMVFGVALWVLSASNALGIGPKDETLMPFFQILIAFLAGFSERWAQDMLGRAADQIGGSSVSAKRPQKR
jgi:hypothetical protein